MNRRKFFGLSAATVAALGLPEIVLPERKIFLPPRSGWYSDLRMREIEQYVIHEDALIVRYDMAWVLNGKYTQYHVDMVRQADEFLPIQREAARDQFRQIMDRDGLHHAKTVRLALPTGLGHRSCYT